MSTISKSTTVQFDIGGTLYKVSLSLLESFPDSMLSSIVSTKWKEGFEEQIFIERDGHRFRYVLDYMRDGKVTLPKGECIEALCTELEYFGIEYESTKISSNDNLNVPESIRNYGVYLNKFQSMKQAQAMSHVETMVTIDIINAALAKFASCFQIIHINFAVTYDHTSQSIEKKLIYQTLSRELANNRNEIVARINENILDMNLRIYKTEYDSRVKLSNTPLYRHTLFIDRAS